MAGFTVPKRTLLAAGNVQNIFGDVSAVSSGSLTNIVSFTVPIGQTFLLQTVEYGGENIARFDFIIDGTLEGRRRTNFGGDFSGEFFFGNLKVAASKILILKVLHNRSETGDFEGRIMGVLE